MFCVFTIESLFALGSLFYGVLQSFASAVYATANRSVRPSVRLCDVTLQSSIVSK